MTWSVIIPSASAENLVEAVTSIFETHPGLSPARVVVVDDGARAGAEEKLPSGITWVEGKKPFIYARNVNLGVQASSPNNTVLMGDDVVVQTQDAFNLLESCLAEHPDLAAISAGIKGNVGNGVQRYNPCAQFIEEERTLAFIAVLIPRWAWEKVGALDERFTGYGSEDADFCLRAKKARYTLGIYKSCLVRHDGVTRSTFRARPDFQEIWEKNQKLFREKWGGEAYRS